MIKHLLLVPFLLITFCLKAQNFTMRPIKCGMEMPWEITYGPDNFIWATEARGYKVSRINPTTGASTVLLNLTNNKNFANYPSVSPQGGLMGLALHPNLLTGKPYVYLAYIYRYDGGSAPTGQFFKTKVVRYTYNATALTLTNEQVLCDTIPGSNDHNGGRLTIANVNGAPYLFYGVGDMGGGQFDNASRKNKAQDVTSYEGKILRFNLEPDADTNVSESWIPNDGANTFGKAIYSIGHRNPQGMVVGKNGQLYEAEHGPYSDDELNLVNANGLNFGFPVVVGMADGNYNNAAVGEGSGVPVIVNEANNATSLGVNYRNPLKAFFPSDNATIRQIYQNSVNNTPPFPNYFLSWNSIAPSGIDYYNSTAIPNWQNSLLVTSLKRQRVYRLQLDATGTAIVGDTLPVFPNMGRYRDLAISPDGTKIYVSCDSEGQTSGPTNGTTIDPPNKGCILEFTYAPNSGSYCASTGTLPWNLWIAKVQLNTLINTSDKYKDYATLGFSDYTNLTTTVTKGQTYPLSITPPTGWTGYFPNVFCRVWIDFNGNNTFEDSEMVQTGTNQPLFTQNITIPTTAITGNVRMRVSMKWGAYPTACETFAQGEVEDYTINIGAGTSTNQADLTLTNLTIPTPSVQQGNILNWKVDIKNIGTAAITGNFNVKAYISTDNVLSADDVQNGIIPTGNFDVGLSVPQVSGASTIPTTVPAGQYYLILKVDADGQVVESNENNNVISSVSTFTVTGSTTTNLPDLTLANIFLTDPAIQQGRFASFTVDIKNIGIAAASGNFTVKAYISSDQILDANDIQNGVIQANVFAQSYPAGYTLSRVASAAQIPATLPIGVYYLILKTDADSQITESNENNNLLVSASFSVTSSGGAVDNYCTSKSNAPWEMWVSEVKFNSLNNVSTQYQSGQNFGYTNFTNLSTSLTKGQTYPLSIQAGLSWIGHLPNAFCRIWIDFNKNNTFEDTEKVMEGTNANPFTTNILIPTTATTGSVRMRVSMKWGSYPTACETFDKGEVEDYTINIQDGTTNSCTNDVTPPVFANCPQNINLTTLPGSISTVAVWTAPTATDNCSTPTITSNYQGGGTFFIGTTTVIYTAKDAQNNTATCTFNINVASSTNTNADIALSLSSTPSVFSRYAPLNFTVSAKNNGNQAFTNIQIEFKFPSGTTNGGTAISSLGTWNEWCAGGVQCFTWTIPTLALNANATLNVPVYVLNPTSPMVATAKLLASTPIDNVLANNTATISLNAAPLPMAFAKTQPTQLIPIIVDKIAPNPSDGEVVVELESLNEREVVFDFTNTFGKTLKTEIRKVEKGTNRVLFEVFDLPQGIYFVSPSTNRGKNAPTKFVKM